MQDIYKHISLTLKTLRQQRKWSLDKTAQETGVSKAMLGQIEREESSPTIATLWKIANGFQTSFSSFLEEVEIDSKEMIYRSSDNQHPGPADDKIRVKTLFPFDPQLNCEMFEIEILPSCEHRSAPHQYGSKEHVLVISGTMQILLNDKWHTLHAGEGMRFNADQFHGYRNITKENVKFHSIIHYEK